MIHNVADFEAYFHYIEKVENAYWTRDVLTDEHYVKNCSLVVNVACKSYSSTKMHLNLTGINFLQIQQII